jgi:predicted ATPase/DNA-binding CsgD family transcriptional regulator
VHGFPAVLTSFIGRAKAGGELGDLLSENRLVTVTGPGGAGKTRLACAVGRRVAGRFADGVWLAELAPVRDPALVAAAVAAALGVREQPGVPAAAALARVLGRQQLLLVLDNCEHVIGAAAALCAELLPAADDVRILTTSREPLRIAGEARYRLAPLALPDPDDTAGVQESEAVALFADRARQADTHFTLTSENASAVARLVRRLDGMPLAIELAAARVEALGLAQLLDRIGDRFGLLVAGDRLAAGRQRSLAATVDWSYQLLNELERRVFRRISVFPAPFTLEAAEAVAGAGAGPAVLRLVDCSLLVPPRPGPDGRSRYVMLETLRAYGAQRLAEAGEQPEAAAALAGLALGVAGQAAAGLSSSAGELDAARWLDAEDATVHQALDWALQHDPGTALSLATALAPWWELRGRFAGGYALLSRAAGDTPEGGTAWCEAQLWLGSLSRYSSFEAGLGHFSAVQDALAAEPASPLLVRALNERVGCLIRLGQLPQAAEEAGRALTLAREAGFPAGQARALYFLGAAAAGAGDVGEGVSWSRQTQLIDPATIPGSLARRCVIGLTMALMEAAELTAAEQACARGLALARQAGDLLDLATCLLVMTDLDLRAGRLPQARAHLREATELESRMNVPLLLADCLDWCGHLCARTQRWADALTAWAAQASFQQVGGTMQEPLPDARRREEPQRKARQALGSRQVAAAEHRGAAMEAGTASGFALLLTASRPPDAPADRGLSQLSGRERELVTLVAQGRTDAQIAGQLYISIRTVRSHLDRIRDKTGCRRRADLTRLALSTGLI